MAEGKMTKNEEKALEICSDEIKKNKLPMTLVDAKYIADERKIVFRFSSENRVDFRELVKVLKEKLHIKVELRQVGSRDKAMEIGGMPTCCKSEVCCKQCGKYFGVSEEMLEIQGVKPSQKMYGNCGRLKCCYSYEFFADGKITENREFACNKCTSAALCPRHAKADGSNTRILYLIRHPETTAPADVYIDGESEIAISAKGKEQIKSIYRIIAKEKITQFFTSPLSRAQQAADALGKILKAPVEIREKLKEINVGEWREMKEEAIQKKFPKLWEAWLAAPDLTKLPQGESLSEVQKRTVKEINSCIQSSEGNIAIICHKLVILTYLLSIEGQPLNSAWRYLEAHPIRNAQITKIDLSTKQIINRIDA
jgi:broad specificity phosphatase PhoE